MSVTYSCLLKPVEASAKRQYVDHGWWRILGGSGADWMLWDWEKIDAEGFAQGAD